MPSLTLVIPVLDEAQGIRGALESILRTLGTLRDCEAVVIVVDDGSSDGTADMVGRLCDEDRRVRLLCLRRHFGKEAAIHAGLAHAPGDAVIVMDGDLQHPPELIPEMVALWRGGWPVVEAVKRSRGPEGPLARLAARSFYGLFAALAGLDVRDHSDFKLLSREAVDAYLALPERQRFFRALVSWLGFRSAQVPFDVPARPRGRRRFTFLRRFALSVRALTSFSSAPLQVITLLGAFTLALAVVFGTIAFYQKAAGLAVSGFTTVILLMLMIGSAVMIGLGIVGAYLAEIYQELKRRPEWLVDHTRSRLPAHERGRDLPAARAGRG